ncbi:MAG: hypothetical protein ACXAD7_05760 [Candidatus Kariarchaeaceae archaeon]|jgi:hypothetical protein
MRPVKLTIKFSNLLAEKIAKKVEIAIDQEQLSLSQFIGIVEDQPWSSEVINNRHVKPPVILVIDNKLIQISNDEDIIITETSDISFQVMFAGG